MKGRVIMGQGSARIFNLVSIIFTVLSVVVIVVVVAQVVAG